jgi:hypothetical protein
MDRCECCGRVIEDGKVCDNCAVIINDALTSLKLERGLIGVDMSTV